MRKQKAFWKEQQELVWKRMDAGTDHGTGQWLMDKIALQTVNCLYFLADAAVEQSSNKVVKKGLISTPAVGKKLPRAAQFHHIWVRDKQFRQYFYPPRVNDCSFSMNIDLGERSWVEILFTRSPFNELFRISLSSPLRACFQPLPHQTWRKCRRRLASALIRTLLFI